MNKKRKASALVLVWALCTMMVIGCTVGGTLAWLTAKSDPIVNTFTDSDINITLDETTTNFKMVPGWNTAKDPRVTVDSNSEDCYVFVKIDKSSNYDTYLEAYTVADGWISLTDKNNETVEGVYYRKVLQTDRIREFYVLKGTEDGDATKNGYVVVKTSVTKELMDAIDGINDNEDEAKNELKNRPTLTFTAYATQYWKTGTSHFEPYEAWDNVFDANDNDITDTEENK